MLRRYPFFTDKKRVILEALLLIDLIRLYLECISKTMMLERGPEKKIQPGELCQVCNEQATGFNYGALTCNPCKSFFRRTVLENNLTQVTLSFNLKIIFLKRNAIEAAPATGNSSDGASTAAWLRKVSGERLKAFGQFSL